MVRFLISAAFWGESLIRGRHLLECSACFDLSVDGMTLVREQHLFEAQHLLEEIQYVSI